MDFNALAKIGRFKEVMMILIKYGFEEVVQRLDLPGADSAEKTGDSDHSLNTFERIRSALEDLGPTFVKLGQIMSLRPDLLPEPLVHELGKLQNDVPPESFKSIGEVIEAGFNKPIEEVFLFFDEIPIAAASLSQVHRGRLRDSGILVSVKVQRPGIRKTIESDLDIIAAVAERLNERSDDLQIYDLPNLVRVTRRQLLREIDFKREARNMRIARTYADPEDGIYIPEVYEDYCTEQILVMEYIQGTNLKDIDTKTLEDPEKLAGRGIRNAIKQILDDGFFHADPHPGNVMISDEKGICLIDWGMVGRLTERDRYELIDLLKAIVEKDSYAMVQALMRLGSAEGSIDEDGLEREVLDILDSFWAVPVKDLNVGQLLMSLLSIMREFQLGLPPDLVVMIKALVTAEGMARTIYPDLNIVMEAEDSVTRLSFKRYKPDVLWKRLRSGVSHFITLQRDIPKRISQIIDKVDKGNLNIRLEHENLGGLRNTLENVTNRLTIGIITAALIVGSSIIITTGIRPHLFGFPALGVIGYMISGLLGLWLVFKIILQRRY